MNKEGVKKYNELLVLYLNEFIGNITQSSDIKDRSIIDAAEKIEELLIEYNITIDKNVIKQIIYNSFTMYSNILKTSFNSANIHIIDERLRMSEIAKEMNEVTTNISKAITESNKIPEYLLLIKKIKNTIIFIISQTNSNYLGHEYDVDQILNDVIDTFYSIYTEDLISSFLRDKLPELYKISDEINFTTSQNSNQNNTNPNFERDQFINETLEIEIHEGFRDGKVTLSITDNMGHQTELVGAKAIEKLKGYNQLYESSRPGKKADTSNWPEEKHMKVPSNNDLVIDLSAPIKNDDSLEIENKQQENPIADNTSQIEETKEIDTINDFNNLTSSNINEDKIVTRNDDEEMIQHFFNQYKNDTLSTQDYSNDESITNDMSNLTIPINNLEQPSNDSISQDGQSTYNSNLFIENNVEETNSFLPSNYNGSKEEFIGNYSNPNYDRDQFIKHTTGIEIQEDVDHQGKLFLRVIEPSGREVIYTGKDAIRMIKNYNQIYLDANPDKTVDTSLIDNSNE